MGIVLRLKFFRLAKVLVPLVCALALMVGAAVPAAA
ncbi:MAG: hypothetical protein QOF25_5421, partial [Mycobacterium sp.]|nr:hypothetical protein [Mycobacterium sp.]